MDAQQLEEAAIALFAGDKGLLGGCIFVFSRHPATRIGDLEGAGEQRIGGTAGFVSPRTLQPGCAPWRILHRDGGEMTEALRRQVLAGAS